MVVITLEHQKRRRTRDTDLAGMSWNEGDETINRSFQLQANGRSVSAVSEFFGPISFDVCTASLGSGPQPGILLTHPRCGLRASVEMLSPAIPGRTDGKDVTGRHSTAVWVGLAQPVEGLEAKTEAPGGPPPQRPNPQIQTHDPGVLCLHPSLPACPAEFRRASRHDSAGQPTHEL